MEIFTDNGLKDIDSEDLGDILTKLEQSFGIKYPKDAFLNVKTFGDLCDVIQGCMTFTNKEDCTTQQAFYKIRSSILSSQRNFSGSINLETKLEDIFPRETRRRDIKNFQQKLGIPIEILVIKSWLTFTITIGFIASLLCFFVKWEYAVGGLIFFFLIGWLSNKFAKEFIVSSVRDLVNNTSREHYLKVRRVQNTMNQKEIVRIIQDVFIAEYWLERDELTPDAALH